MWERESDLDELLGFETKVQDSWEPQQQYIG